MPLELSLCSFKFKEVLSQLSGKVFCLNILCIFFLNLKTTSLYPYDNLTNFDHAACISVVSSCAMSNFFLVVIQCNGGWRPNLQLTDRVETL